MCQSLATSRSLPGTYRALLATAGHAAIEPFDIDPSKRPWIRMDGVPLSATASDFADGKLLAALDVQQDGATYSVFRVWTGAATTGEPGTATCGDWTNTMDASGTRSGHSPATSSTFFNQMAATCGATMTLHLYCLEE
jgi:hypothetical protein